MITRHASLRSRPCPCTHVTQLRPRRVKARATPGDPADGQPHGAAKGNPSSVEEASQRIFELFSALGQDDGIQQFMDWVPDSALDSLIEARKAAGKGITSLTAHDMCEHHHTMPAESLQFSIDSYANRLLLWDTPRTIQSLSAISMGPEKSVHRFHLTSTESEEVTLTLVVEKQESLVGRYRSAPRIESTWRLRSLAGESELDASELTSPSPSIGPELVVAAQLSALASKDIARVFAFASPANQAITGPVERFGQMLQSPQFRPLLGHTESHSLRRVMYGRDAYVELVAVRLAAPGPVNYEQHWLYLWEVQREPARHGPWTTQAVRLVNATNRTGDAQTDA